MTDCTVRIAPGEPIAPHLADGAVICLAPGRHEAALRIEHSLTLRGEPGAVLDAGGRGPVVHVPAHELRVVLRGLTLTGGQADWGAGLRVEGYSEVQVEGCTVEGNQAARGGATGLGARRGDLTVRGCTFGPADDVVITNTARAALSGTTVGGDLLVTDGAQIEIDGGRVGGTLRMRGTTSRRPTVALRGVDAPRVDNDASLPADLSVSGV